MTDPRVIAVASGKGGVGKSTITANLALALAGRGRRVGILDLDVFGPDIPALFGITRRRPATSILLARKGGMRYEALERHGVRLMSTQFLIAEDQAIAWSAQLVDILLGRFFENVDWGGADTIVVDLPPGTADVQQRLARGLPHAEVIVVVTPQDVAHLDAKKVLAMFEKTSVRILGGVENMAGLTCPHCGGHVDVYPDVQDERSIWAAGLTKLASVPLDPAISQAGELGRPIVLSHPDSPQAKAFGALAAAVSER